MDHHEPSAGSQLTRRSFLAAATPVLGTAGSALAQPSAPPPGPRVKGPRVGLAKEYAFAAELFVHAGAHLVLPDHVWVQDAGGNLIPLAEQVRRAVAWVYRNAHSFGGNPNRIYVSGHCSGAHLAGVVLTTD